MSERMRSISAESLSFCAAASVGSQPDRYPHPPNAASSQPRGCRIRPNSRTTAAAANQCSGSADRARWRAGEIHGASACRGLRARLRARCTKHSAAAVASERASPRRARTCAASARQAGYLPAPGATVHSREPAPSASAECIHTSARACKPRLIMVGRPGAGADLRDPRLGCSR